eukprot:TRINITY_DN2585_c0_g1_i1.p1 TRINITY_DN2585_c0_g1~~TRINITY_DN2585_c0_g1_i1.p1  ORF type:complete len:114 (-),score=10.38 TRINITY_DN2585_c0_g1_i1:384-725(-)
MTIVAALGLALCCLVAFCYAGETQLKEPTETPFRDLLLGPPPVPFPPPAPVNWRTVFRYPYRSIYGRGYVGPYGYSFPPFGYGWGYAANYNGVPLYKLAPRVPIVDTAIGGGP